MNFFLKRKWRTTREKRRNVAMKKKYFSSPIDSSMCNLEPSREDESSSSDDSLDIPYSSSDDSVSFIYPGINGKEENEEDESSSSDDSLVIPYSSSDDYDDDCVLLRDTGMNEGWENEKDESSSLDDSLEIPYSSGDDNVALRDIGLNREEESKKSDDFVKNGMKSDETIKGMESLSDDKDGGEDENKESSVFVEKTGRNGKMIKRMNRKKENNSAINKGHPEDCCLRTKKVPGINIVVESNQEHKTSKSQMKDPQFGKSPWCSSAYDDPECSKWECSGEKKESSKEVMENLGTKISRSARDADLMRMLLNYRNKGNINVEGSGFIQEPLPLKFRFEDEVVPPTEKSEQEEEIDSLFLEMELCFRAPEMESTNLSKSESDDIPSKEVDESPEACCGRGEHQSILDEQIGLVCKFCGAIILEIKDMLPHWYTPRSRVQERKYFDKSPSFVHGEFQFHHESANGRSESFSRAKGNVWDLIPGYEKGMYPHQREGFEFLWKSIGGDIELDKLPKSLSDGGRGCIISHAPGTGKTRLTVVFLLSFLKRYPKTQPMIIAPQAILSTWEKELGEWKVDIPFHNMNNTKLLGNETRFGGGKGVQGVRLGKLLSWITGGGILGISYQLFGSLVSTKGEQEEGHVEIRNTLLKNPGLLVLDEGHTPRNGDSRIWKAVKSVTSKRCIILSGTPFQNSFKELKHTLCLVDPSFQEMSASSWKEMSEGDDGLKKLRSLLDPYVNLHDGSVLQNSLLGLKDTTIYLHPTELQKELMNAAMKEENILTRTHLVSLISVHPLVLMVDEKKKFINNRIFSSHKDKIQEIESDLDEGVKIKFVINLIQLVIPLGERVLIFSQYINPLIFIKEQLKTYFSWSEGKEVLYMDGNLSEKKRQESISSFNNGLSEAKVLLASQRACSEGINLVGASRVVLLDTVWNPSVEKQAISRAYRLGQKKTVYVYRLITCGMEVRQFELQSRKVYISKSIFSRVDEQAGEAETSDVVLEDKVLERMHNLESLRNIFDKIVHQAAQGT